MTTLSFSSGFGTVNAIFNKIGRIIVLTLAPIFAPPNNDLPPLATIPAGYEASPDQSMYVNVYSYDSSYSNPGNYVGHFILQNNILSLSSTGVFNGAFGTPQGINNTTTIVYGSAS